MRKLLPFEEEAVELVDHRENTWYGDHVLITCEHAHNVLPPPYNWGESDSQFSPTHWAFDIGARETTIELAQRIGAVAILAKYSRLLLDANRLITSDTLFRTHCDGTELELNKNISIEERYNRINKYHAPFYHVLGEAVQELEPSFILSIHTFTPNYQGSIREVEIGVLYEEENVDIASYMVKEFSKRGYDARFNEPWSGCVGILAGNVAACTYSMAKPRIRGIELEIRNDLASNPESRERIVELIVGMLTHILSRFCGKKDAKSE